VELVCCAYNLMDFRPRFFYPLYPAHKTIPALYDIFFFPSIVVRYAQVGQISSLNDGELLHLEDSTTLNCHECHALHGQPTNIYCIGITNPLFY